ncbi:hypothetical protein [Streptomyces sp. NPDC054849]
MMKCPSELPPGSLVVIGAGGVKHQLQLDEPWPALEDEEEGEGVGVPEPGEAYGGFVCP